MFFFNFLHTFFSIFYLIMLILKKIINLKNMENEREKSIRDIEISERREKFNHREDFRASEKPEGISYKAKNKKI